MTRFEHRAMASASDWDSLLDELLERGPQEAVRSNLRPAIEIFRLLEARGCKTVLIEDPYMDEDHRQCHHRLHYLTQANTSRYCKRLHFFSGEFSANDLSTKSSDIWPGYMGMCVWRPTNAFPVGRTVLSRDLVQAPPGKNWESYLVCCARHPAHLAGSQPELFGAAFIQQDHLVARCATAALWMTQWQMACRFEEFSKHYSPEITDSATRYDLSLGRAVPSEGLNNRQMLEAFRALGYDPIAHDLIGIPARLSRRLLYSLIESEIPVVVGLDELVDGHAVAVFGHGLAPNTKPDVLKFSAGNLSYGEIRYADSSDYASGAFIICDDAVGPYRWMQLVDTEQVSLTTLKSVFKSVQGVYRGRRFLKALLKEGVTTAAVFLDHEGNPEHISGCDFLAAPLPPAVTLSPMDAQRKALACMLTVEGEGVDHEPLPEFSVRTLLLESEVYKRYLLKVTGSSPKFSWWMRSSHLPKWVWVTEFAYLEDSRWPLDRRVVASVVIDCAASRDTLDFVLMHSLGWVIPVERHYRDVLELVGRIASGEDPTLKDETFKPYKQFTKGLLEDDGTG